MDLLQSAKNIIATVAPAIASAFGTPLAGMAVKQLLPIFGITESATSDEISKAIMGATPEQLMAVKKADQDFAIKMRELDINLSNIVLNDKDSARKRESFVKDWTPRFLAILTIIGYIVTQYYLLTNVIDSSMREMVMRALGNIDALIGIVFSYYFGASMKDVTPQTKPETK